jgi:hypothetical protein
MGKSPVTKGDLCPLPKPVFHVVSTIESFVVHLPSIETVGLPIDSREVPFTKCAFRQSPNKNNIDIAREDKNQTSLSFPYLSFCLVLDSYSVD